MKFLRYITIVIVVVLSVQSTQAQEIHFFDELYDVPVMEGLVVLPEQAMSFDKPNGQISQVIAYAPNLEWASIALFYKESLLQMGWRARGEDKYSREEELLEITYEGTKDKSSEATESGLIIRFLLYPA
jgi:hypothetical protein